MFSAFEAVIALIILAVVLAYFIGWGIGYDEGAVAVTTELIECAKAIDGSWVCADIKK